MKTGIIIAIVAAIVIVAGVAAVVMMNNSSPSGDTDYTVTITIDNGTVDHSSVKVKSGTTWTTSANVLSFSDGQKVTATAKSGYEFSSWSPSSGKVTSATTIKATCVAPTAKCTVTITAETGGKVSPTKLTVNAGTTWTSSANTLSFSDGQKVTATPDSGYTFKSWSPTSGIIFADLSITASFTESVVNYKVTITAGTGGKVSPTSLTVPAGTTWTSSANVLNFSDGQKVTATADSGYAFSAWSTASGTVNSDTSINASFSKSTVNYKVTVTAGTGGKVSPTSLTVPAGTTWTSSGATLTFSNGQKVTATANSGYSFSSWSPSSGTVNSDTTVTAKFASTPSSYTVTISAGTGGQVSKTSVTADKGVTWSSSGSTLTFSNGQSVTATPNTGYTFSAWSPASGTVSGDTTITASFSGSVSKEVSFYFYDNFENDGFHCTDQYETFPYAVIPGVWVKGTGSDMESAFKDACSNFGITATVSSGKITNMNGVSDGNLYIWAWTGSEWVCKLSKDFVSSVSGVSEFITFSDLSVSDYSYVAVVHGATTKDGNAPAVNTTPNNITWYYGDTIAPGSGKCVTFYIGNNFEYTTFVSDRTDASDYKHLIVQGLWIRGYTDLGNTVGDAFCNAMERIGYEYSYSAGWIAYINDCSGGNMNQDIWNDAAKKWYRDPNVHYFNDLVDDVNYAVATYGAWGGGADEPPHPLDNPPVDWAY